jgi:DNA mismatch endonuclease (patch repair protein)
MADIVDAATRSRMMSGIRGRNTRPELLVRRFLFGAGLRYRLHPRSLRGTPDLVLPRHRAVVFVHGCFWHRHRGCRFAYRPKSNEEFWRAKLDGNVARDAEVETALRQEGWRVFTIWECSVGPSALAQLRSSILEGTTHKRVSAGRNSCRRKPIARAQR